VTTAPTGLGSASFTVDRTNRVVDAHNRGAGDMTFEISGSDETLPTISPPGSTDRRTVYRVGPLLIKHLGSAAPPI
jgi:hypothetical protein